MRILIADDEPTSRLILKLAVRNLGQQCKVVADGIRAWESITATPPDLIISDWMMPGLSGLELCQKVRADPRLEHTYFIMVTSQGARQQVVEGMNAGADDYLVKPINPADLAMRLIAATRVTALHQQVVRQQAELERLNHNLAATARRDPLTDLGNRRALQEDLAVLESRVSRYGHRYCLALFDVDHFKAYNDTYGHQAGDRVLHTVAAHLMREARGGDALYRYGGEEFLCLLPEQSLAQGIAAAERMRSGLERLAIPHLGNGTGVLTISAGLAMLDPDQARPSRDVLQEADSALYHAKSQGRNRVEHLGLHPVDPPGV